jgi:hypothetical protein
MIDKSAPGGTLAFVLPIDAILQRLAVTLVSNHHI